MALPRAAAVHPRRGLLGLLEAPAHDRHADAVQGLAQRRGGELAGLSQQPLTLGHETAADDDERRAHPVGPGDEVGQRPTRRDPTRIGHPRQLAHRGGGVDGLLREGRRLRPRGGLLVEEPAPPPCDAVNPARGIGGGLASMCERPFGTSACLLARAPGPRERPRLPAKPR